MSSTLQQIDKEIGAEHEDYCLEYLAPEIVEKLEAGAFRQLCHHLQERSDSVANIDLMTLSGFCRNCLAKWMVVEARKLSESTNVTYQQALDALGYEEAAQHVYGMTYGTWKKRYQKKATDEQMARYQASEPLQAKHDKALLATRGEKPQKKVYTAPTTNSGSSGGGLMSNVCCQDVEDVTTNVHGTKNQTETKYGRTTTGSYQPPPVPTLDKPVRVAILTVSDRAAAGTYATGDLSGPAVATAVQQIIGSRQCEILPKLIVPDDKNAIQAQLRAWSRPQAEGMVVDLIFTTGGTGMAARDVTPEATREILDTECAGLMSFVAAECSRLQPLATLTRGTAGILGRSLVANLPGNPNSVGEIMPLLLPLLLHAHQDMRTGEGPS